MRVIVPLALCSLSLLATSMAIAAEPLACEALQQEVQSLRARLQQYEAAAALMPLPAPAPLTASPPATASMPSALPSPAAVSGFDTALPGTAPKPQAKQVITLEEPYSDTGCRLGYFTPMKPAVWQNKDLWLDLEAGMTPAQVEAILGVEHYDGHDGPNVVWGYGKCKAAYKAKAMFSNGKLADWRAPR